MCTITMLYFPAVLWPKQFLEKITVISPYASMTLFFKIFYFWGVNSGHKSLIHFNAWGTYCSSQLYTKYSGYMYIHSSTEKNTPYNIGKGYLQVFSHVLRVFFPIKNSLLHWLITVIKFWIHVVWAGTETIMALQNSQ